MGRLTRLLVEQSFRRVSHQVAISENVRQSVRRFTAGRIDPHVILPAVPDGFLPKETADGRPFGDQSLVLGFVGHHKPEKGLDLALDAIRDALSAGSDVSLLAVTSGTESQGGAADEIKSMVEEKALGERVRLVSGIRDIRDFYSQIDLLLIPFRGTRGPSDYPMVLLEAMSLGIPVVCTPVGAMPEVVVHGRNGFLASDVSSAAFASALAEALKVVTAASAGISAHALETAARFRAFSVCTATLDFFAAFNNKCPP
jgi:glycosyltransferase involved in cell wall biosynthesis